MERHPPVLCHSAFRNGKEMLRFLSTERRHLISRNIDSFLSG